MWSDDVEFVEPKLVTKVTRAKVSFELPLHNRFTALALSSGDKASGVRGAKQQLLASAQGLQSLGPSPMASPQPLPDPD